MGRWSTSEGLTNHGPLNHGSDLTVMRESHSIYVDHVGASHTPLNRKLSNSTQAPPTGGYLHLSSTRRGLPPPKLHPQGATSTQTPPRRGYLHLSSTHRGLPPPTLHPQGTTPTTLHPEGATPTQAPPTGDYPHPEGATPTQAPPTHRLSVHIRSILAMYGRL